MNRDSRAALCGDAKDEIPEERNLILKTRTQTDKRSESFALAPGVAKMRRDLRFVFLR